MMPRNPEFLATVAEEVKYQVRRLMHHASIVLWSGSNENESALTWFPVTRDNRDLYVVEYAALYFDTVWRTIYEEDSEANRPFWPSSPSNGPLVTDRTPVFVFLFLFFLVCVCCLTRWTLNLR
jgi:beta-mannosidase